VALRRIAFEVVFLGFAFVFEWLEAALLRPGEIENSLLLSPALLGQALLDKVELLLSSLGDFHADVATNRHVALPLVA